MITLYVTQRLLIWVMIINHENKRHIYCIFTLMAYILPKWYVICVIDYFDWNVHGVRGLWCLTPHSTIFQLYRGDPFNLWR